MSSDHNKQNNKNLNVRNKIQVTFPKTASKIFLKQIYVFFL